MCFQKRFGGGWGHQLQENEGHHVIFHAENHGKRPGDLQKVEVGEISAPLLCMSRMLATGAAESWWGCSDSDSDSRLLIDSDSVSDSDSDSDSGPDTKHKINIILTVERASPSKRNKTNQTFPIDFGFHSFGRRIFIPVSLMPDHLLGIGNGVMAVSRIFACRSVPVPYASYVLAPNARTVYLLHAHAVTITPTHFTPAHFNLVQSASRKKRPRGAAGATEINMLSLRPACHCFRKGNFWKLFLLL